MPLLQIVDLAPVRAPELLQLIDVLLAQLGKGSFPLLVRRLRAGRALGASLLERFGMLSLQPGKLLRVRRAHSFHLASTLDANALYFGGMGLAGLFESRGVLRFEVGDPAAQLSSRRFASLIEGRRMLLLEVFELACVLLLHALDGGVPLGGVTFLFRGVGVAQLDEASLMGSASFGDVGSMGAGR